MEAISSSLKWPPLNFILHSSKSASDISMLATELGKAGSSFFLASTNEDKEKASRELLEVLKILEEQGLGDKKFFGGSEIGLVDLSFGILGLWFDCMQELVGVTLLEPTKFPRLYTWVNNLQQEAVIKENLPDKNKFMGHLKQVREMRMRD